jgi:hypothetical protein
MHGCPFSGGGGYEGMKCPFSSAEFRNAPTENFENPPFVIPEPCFTKVYVSPYATQLDDKVRRSKVLIQQLKLHPFYLQNTLFHDSLFVKQRTNALIMRLLLGEELRRKGNIAYWKDDFDEAIECYELGIGVYSYLVEQPGPEGVKLQLVEAEEDKAEDRTSVQNMLEVLKTNLTKVLIKAQYLKQAAQVQLSDTALGLGLSSLAVACNKDSSLEALARAEAAAEQACSKSSEYSGLVTFSKALLTAKQHENSRSLSAFAKQLEACTIEMNLDDEENFEYAVLRLMEHKYNDMMKFYKSINKPVAKTQANFQLLLAPLSQMKWLAALQKQDLISHGVSIELANSCKFEVVRHQCMTKVFSSGHYNQELLEHCVQQLAQKRAGRLKSTDAASSWTKWVVLGIVLALIGLVLR